MYRACIFKDLNFVVFIFEGIDAESKKREESSSLVKLELGIAGCGHVNPVRQKQEKAESSFTAEQLRELYYQTLVFNFIAYGLPVPFHFLLPIWKSIFQSDPSFTGFSIQNSDHGSMMDPELGRCRRTDGRKWRCSNNSLPKEKYCDRHMHRGRKCSRKHVERSKSDANNEILTSNIINIPSKTVPDPSYDTLTPDIRIKPISSSIPFDLDLTFSSSNPSNGVPAIKHGSNKNHDFIQPTIKACRHNVELKNNPNGDAYNAASITPTRASGKEANGNSSMKNGNNHSEGKDAGFNNVKARKVQIRNNNVFENNYAGSNAPGFGVSRDSILQSVSSEYT
ncbi:growth-regulating factor 9 [Olea europaea subsp. europaea]|uniref:Growth-regulating factor n=1 Tax=Olea europaea subsp. europaea TaxID=158383 RepID=A0A8S0RHB7_OLEEU|nr:growth-regulating factor 9 [Olea europaea subsp. europaea]